jgi:UDP-N-acetylmuramoyl-L-alanyl-D-glutamate--2,6-diaminopimelate ligase
MRLVDILDGIECDIKGDADVEICDLKYDSRQVCAGDLFFCITGFEEDGHKYAPDAAARGAAAIVATREIEGLDTLQVIVKNDRQAMALAAVRFFGSPASSMKTVGVTGTNGKTTTTYMMKSIAEAAGMKVGLIGTICNMIGAEEIPAERTTPESVDLQRLLARMRDSGCDLVVMEVSSHSLFLRRVEGIRFDVGIFTNLSQDHMDFHKTWQNYVDAKKILFKQSEAAVINVDDEAAADMIGAAKNELLRFGVQNRADIMPEALSLQADGTSFFVRVRGKKTKIRIPIPGMFTVYNAMGAIGAADKLSIGADAIARGLAQIRSVPGRFELLDTHGKDYSIILDYAHSPDSLENTLLTIRDFAPGRIVTVFGCGGNRDRVKRPIMGRIAEAYSDFVVITSDNPRFEEPEAIIKEIEEGLEGKTPYILIENRREAICYAIKNAQEKDIILLAGKGHETYQEICGKKHDFDEKVVVEQIFSELQETNDGEIKC